MCGCSHYATPTGLPSPLPPPRCHSLMSCIHRNLDQSARDWSFEALKRTQGPPVILLSSSLPALPLVNMLRFDTSPALLVFVLEVVQGGTESLWKLLMSISE